MYVMASSISFFGIFFSIFESGGITKHLMTEGLGKTKFTVSFVASHYVLIFCSVFYLLLGKVRKLKVNVV